MFVINCPYCGKREQSEFKAGGEAHIIRPKQPTELSDDQWACLLYTSPSPRDTERSRMPSSA